MPPVVTMSQLLEAGVHYGHRTHRWNPKMKPYIHGEQKGIYIIDLRQTLKALGEVYVYVRDLVKSGGTILFVGTKSPISDNVRTYAEKCNMPYVSERWLGGTLTNFVTVFAQVTKLEEYQAMMDAGRFDLMSKKEALQYTREMTRLKRNLGGIRFMRSVPEAIFIMDIEKEHIAVTEAQKLGIVTVGVVDTNCNPDGVDYIIPGNDDSILSGGLMCRVVSEAVMAGRQMQMVDAPAPAPEPAPADENTPTDENALTDELTPTDENIGGAEAPAVSETAELETPELETEPEEAKAEDV